MLDLVRIGELFYQLIPKFAMLEPLQLDYPGWLHKFAKEAKPYHVPCELSDQQLPFRSRPSAVDKPRMSKKKINASDSSATCLAIIAD